MASTITAGNATNNGTSISSDNTGILEIKTGTGSGTTAMTLNASANVGIGTASPTAPLDVNGNVAITGSARRITGDFSNATFANRVMFQSSTVNGNTLIGAIPNGTGQNARIQTFASSDPTNTATLSIESNSAISQAAITSGITGTGTYLPMTFYTNGSERMRIDSSGNVGIGTNSPGKKLDVFNSGTTTTDFVVRNGTVSLLSFVDGAAAYTGTGTNHPLLFTTNNTERMRIDSSGNVGIGTTAVRGGTSVNALSGYTASNNGVNIPYFQLYNANAGANLKTWRFGSDSAGVLIFETVNDAYSAATERARIDSSGNLCLGTTGSVGLFTATNNSASQATAFFSNTAASSQATPSAYFRKFDNTSTTSQVFLQFQINNGAAGSGQINANGASAAAFGAFSDSRLKENITDLPSQLSNIMALRPVEFDYIESEGGGHQIGFIAQEVKEIYPDLVGERADGMFTLTDMNKNDARLIKAIQELKAELDVCKEEIAALKGAK